MSYSFIYNLMDSFTSMWSIILCILDVVGLWLVFKKAGREGWASLIPFYRDYKLMELAGATKYFVAYLILYLVEIALTIALIPIATAMVFSYSADSLAVLMVLIVLAIIGVAIAEIVIRVKYYLAVCRAFHLSGAWVLGFLFLSGVFYLIIGLSSNIRYYGPEGVAPYEQDPYGQNPYGQNPYGAPQNEYQQNPYGAPQDGYQQNPYGAPQGGYQQNTYQQPSQTPGYTQQPQQPAQPAQNQYVYTPGEDAATTEAAATSDATVDTTATSDTTTDATSTSDVTSQETKNDEA